MLLRSSSSPGIKILLSPLSDSPSRDSETIEHHPLPISFSHNFRHLNLTPFSCSNSSPISELNQETSNFGAKGFRRAWSDRNLERLAYTNISFDRAEFFHSTTPPKTLLRRQYHNTMLHTAPSFSILNDVQGVEEEKEQKQEEALMRTVTIGENIDAIGSREFSFEKSRMNLIEEEGEEEQEEGGLYGIEGLSIVEEKEPVSPPMYLAAGLGIHFGGRGGGGGGDGLASADFDDESGDAEEYYKRMVAEYPCHPLVLRNYAQLLQSKADLHGAEEYYHRAVVIDPEDGEILMRYAKLVWELHGDQDQALRNFERAVQAAPQDSHVIAAYASFLWEIDLDVEENKSEPSQIGPEKFLNKLDNAASKNDLSSLQLQEETRIGAKDHAAFDANNAGNIEEYYKKMLEENPSNSLVLRNYAQFLYQSKGDLQGAEEYYSRAILADPGDGEIMSQYAKLVWELHQDCSKASSYFERAVQATPEDSHILASYASFLWETEESEEDSAGTSQFEVPIQHQGAVSTTANAYLQHSLTDKEPKL